MDDEEFQQLAPNLQSVVDNVNLKWIKVSGKGGVGKTSTSCALALTLAKKGYKTLILSLDPAHNISDAFDQPFGPTATPVQGVDNLYGMEMGTEFDEGDFKNEVLGGADGGEGGNILSGFGDIMSNIPGITEGMAMFEMLKQVEKLEFDKIVFDMAPTGHSLTLLKMPQTMGQLLEKIGGLKSQLGGVLGAVTSLLGPQQQDGEDNMDMFAKLEKMHEKVKDLEAKFQDPNFTTFIAVAIPEFLSLFETERLVQELVNIGIDVQNIVVNQILVPIPNNPCGDCLQCKSRMKMQQKYLDQMDLLYGMDFHLVKMPLLLNEVRGLDSLEKFGAMLLSGVADPLALEPSKD